MNFEFTKVIRKACGNFEDGSSCVLEVWQDDGTKEWCISFDDVTIWDNSFDKLMVRFAEIVSKRE